MKKIIATVLAMVMALALCTTAFAAVTPDACDIYLATSDNIKNGALSENASTATTGVANVTITENAAVTKTDGTGAIAYLEVSDKPAGASNAAGFVKTTSPTTNDYAVTAAGKTTILYYITAVDAVEYTATAKAFTNFGYKCDQYPNTTNEKYYEITACATAADVGKLYKAFNKDASPAETAAYILVDGKIVKVANTKLVTKAHNWTVSASKVENGKVIPTEAVCGICGSKSTAIYKDGEAPAGSVTATLNGATGYVVVPNGASTVTPSTDGKTDSPKTFDAGIAMYVGMALTSVAGSAVVIGKKKEF